LADVFISYSREDQELVQSLAESLQAEGLSVWWDRNIGGGAEFATAIERELSAAKTVVVAWSTASIGSHWVRDEADYARGENKLLPLSLDGVLPPLGFRQLHALQFKGWNQNADHPAFAALLSSLGQDRSSTTPSTEKTKSTWAKPGIVVLPFTSLSTDKEVEFLADGITEDVITALSTIQHVSVAARSSSFAYKERSVDVRAVGQALGARYVVEGSVRKMGKRARVAAQFVSVESGAQIWANKFDFVLEELQDDPDELVTQICGNVFAQLIASESERAKRLPPEAMGIWEHCQLAAGYFRRWDVALETITRTLDDLEREIATAPEYGLGHALLSWGYNAAIVNGAYERDQFGPLLQKAKKHLKIARIQAGDDLYCLTWIGASETFAGLHDRAAPRLERVLERNPANVEAWYMLCQAYAQGGRYAEARSALDRVRAIAPEAGLSGFHRWYSGYVSYAAGDYEDALPHLKAQGRLTPSWAACHALTAISCFILGDEDEARKYIAKAKDPNPHLRPDRLAGIVRTQQDRDKGAREYAILEQLWHEDSEPKTQG